MSGTGSDGSLGCPRTSRRSPLPLKARYRGALDGAYVVLEFASSFERKAAAIETVTPMKDEDGTWRVCAYYIK